MSILKIARLGHPILCSKAKPVKDIRKPDIKELINDMTETMLDAKGIGLAAPQVHINNQIMIFRAPEDQENEENQIKITALINPSITKTSNETENDWEGCLSIPGMLGLVRRYSKISYEGIDINGNIIKRQAEGIHARIVQHEYDHLMGIVYTHRLADKRAYGYVDEIEEYWKNNYEKK